MVVLLIYGKEYSSNSKSPSPSLDLYLNVYLLAGLYIKFTLYITKCVLLTNVYIPHIMHSLFHTPICKVYNLFL